MTGHWEISVKDTVDRTDGDISETLQSLKWLSQCQNTHTHFDTLLLLGYIASDIPACCYMAVGYFFFIKQLKLITMTRIPNHYQLFHRMTLLTEALWYTRVEFMAVSLLMVLRHVKRFGSCSTTMQTHCTCDFVFANETKSAHWSDDFCRYTSSQTFRHIWTNDSNDGCFPCMNRLIQHNSRQIS